MKTNNEKWHGSPKPKSGASAGRDGKPFEKRDVKSILKGSRGAAKFGINKPGNHSHSTGESDFKRNDNKQAYGERKPWENRETKPASGEKKSFELRADKPAYGEKKSFHSSESRSTFSGPKKPWENRDSKPAYGERKPWENREGSRPAFSGHKKPWENRESKPKPWEDRTDSNGEKVYGRNYDSTSEEPRTGKLSFRKPGEGQKSEFIETRYDNKKDGVTYRKPIRKSDDYNPNAKYSNKKQLEFQKVTVDLTKPLRLNKFLANAGICSRREADEYIQAGVISVNGEIVTEMGVKVLLTDKVMFHDQPVRSERKVYLLLNKPKDCVTTSEDTHDRLTVLDLVKNACSERIYPVGRLDRNTTGVLLLTNDGDLASKLTHPKYDKKKIYHATLDKPLQAEDFESIMTGVSLDDGVIAADALEFVKEGDLKQVGIEIHSGQNRVVRRIFEKLGYKIIRLDRVYFAGLTKKSLPRGKYRFLNEREISMLKMGAHE